MIEHCRRDERMLGRFNSPSENSDFGLRIMPDLLKNISNFNGDTVQATSWLESVPKHYITRLTKGASLCKEKDHSD